MQLFISTLYRFQAAFDIMNRVMPLNHAEFVVENFKLRARRFQRTRIKRFQAHIFPDKHRIGTLPCRKCNVSEKIFFESHSYFPPPCLLYHECIQKSILLAFFHQVFTKFYKFLSALCLLPLTDQPEQFFRRRR